MTLVHVSLRRPSMTGLVGANGVLKWKPSTRLVEPPIITMPSPFNAPLGHDLLDDDGNIIEAGVAGDAWIEVEPTGPEWAWLVTERVDGADRTRWFTVPDVPLVEYTSLIEVDPDTLDPDLEPPDQAAWDAALSNEITARTSADTILTDGLADEVVARTAADATLTSNLSSESTTRGAADTALATSVADEATARAAADTALGTDITTEASARATADNLRLLKSANLSDLGNTGTARTNLGLGTAATQASGAFATAAQGTKADTAVQPGDLADVATSGDYDDLINTPPTSLPVSLTEGANIDISGTYPDFTISGTDPPVQSVNTQTGDVVLGSDDVPAGATNKYVTAAEKTKLASLSGTNTGDQDLSGYVPTTRTVAGHALSSNVTVSKSDVGLPNVDNTADTAKPVSTAQATADTAATTAAQATSAQRASNLSDLANAGTARTNLGLGNVDNTSDTSKVASGPIKDAIDAEATTRFDDDQTLATGLANEATARDNADTALNDAFGAALATKQPLDSDLTTIAGLTATTDNFMVAASSAWASRTPAQAKTSLSLAKGDVGLGNVDNTSNATERAATATLTNKTLTSPVINTPTGIVKGDVGLGNVDNTSNATERAAAATLTNKRITKRVVSTADTATLTIDSDSYDGAKVTALAQAMTIAAPTGTPTAMQSLIIRILDNGTARALTWNAAFRAIGVTLPTTTVISKTVYVGAVWNVESSTWDCLGVAVQA